MHRRTGSANVTRLPLISMSLILAVQGEMPRRFLIVSS
jgi:hypothetical protein